VLKEHGVKPAPDRPTSWRTFIRSHADLIVAADFFTTEVWTARGLVRCFTLFFIDLTTREVYVAGTTTNPNSAWMERIARNVTDAESGFLRKRSYLILDRDALFAPRFKGMLEEASVSIVLTAYQAPNMNAYAERFVRSIKAECLDRMIFLGQRSLETAIREYVAHYHGERPHQGRGNELLRPDRGATVWEIVVTERLGGLLKYYHRDVA
jgi:transposase InsO family protein